MRRVAVTLCFRASAPLGMRKRVGAAAGDRPRPRRHRRLSRPFPSKKTCRGSITYVEYKPGMLMAVVPSGKSEQAPCVVILHGHTVETTFYHPLAKAVAEEGRRRLHSGMGRHPAIG